MKKVLVLISIFVLALTINVFADTDVKVLMNDEYINFVDENNQVVNPEITNSRTMVPLRKIFEELGATVEWNQETKTVTATKGVRTIELTIGEEAAYVTVNGYTNIAILDSVAYIKDNRTLVPLRFVSEALGCCVGWDQETKTAIIISLEGLIEDVLSECTNFNEFLNNIKIPNTEFFDILCECNLIENFIDDDNSEIKLKFNIFNKDDKIIIKILNVESEEGKVEEYIGKYISLKNILNDILDYYNIDIENPQDTINTYLDENFNQYFNYIDIEMDTYSLVKNSIVEVLNNNRFRIMKNGNNVKYSYNLNTKDLSFMKYYDEYYDESDIELIVDTKNKIINNIEFKLSKKDEYREEIINGNVNIKYTESKEKLPADEDIIDLFEKLFGGINIIDKTELAIFLNDLGNVQDAIILKMSYNINKIYPQSDTNKFKNRYYNIVDSLESDAIAPDYENKKLVDYTDSKNPVNLPASYTIVVDGETLDLYKVLVDKLNISITNSNYYIDYNGKVYYIENGEKGKEINGIEYYTNNFVKSNPNNESALTVVTVKAK